MTRPESRFKGCTSVAGNDWRARLTRAGALWFVLLVNKCVMLLFGIKLARLGGAECLGVLASVCATSWIVALFAGQGLPDRALFLGANPTSDQEARSAHSRYLFGIGVAYPVLYLLAPGIGGIAELGSEARLFVVGAAGEGLGAFAWAWLRGRGEPNSEACSQLVGGAVLCVGLLLSATVWGVALAWALAG